MGIVWRSKHTSVGNKVDDYVNEHSTDGYMEHYRFNRNGMLLSHSPKTQNPKMMYCSNGSALTYSKRGAYTNFHIDFTFMGKILISGKINGEYYGLHKVKTLEGDFFEEMRDD